MYERQEKWESNLSEIALLGVVLVTQKDNPVNQTGPSQGSGLIETVWKRTPYLKTLRSD